MQLITMANLLINEKKERRLFVCVSFGSSCDSWQFLFLLWDFCKRPNLLISSDKVHQMESLVQIEMLGSVAFIGPLKCVAGLVVVL